MCDNPYSPPQEQAEGHELDEELAKLFSPPTIELVAGERIEAGQFVYRDGSGRAWVLPRQESRPAGE